MTRCTSTAYLIVEGREVAVLPCDLEAGHEVSVGPLDNPEAIALAGARLAAGRPFAATPHQRTLTWDNPESLIESWPEWDDPDESFDLEVDIAPAVEVGHALEHLIETGAAVLPDDEVVPEPEQWSGVGAHPGHHLIAEDGGMGECSCYVWVPLY